MKRLVPKRFRKDETLIPVVRLSGVITAAHGLRPTLNLAGVASALDRAFRMRQAPAVALVINSPGGSPVQSRLIYQRIRALAGEKNKPVLIFVEDVAASGGYMIALAGDEIFADPTSIIGSIGVVAAGFGFVDLIEKIGVERRIYTSGDNKMILDPFRPTRPQDVEHLQSLQEDIHEIFIDMVKDRRGDLLREDEDLFSGLFWTGRRARELGLVDEMGDLVSVLKAKFGPKARPKLIASERSFWFRRGGVGSIAATWSADALVSSLDERAHWARFGL